MQSFLMIITILRASVIVLMSGKLGPEKSYFA